MYRGFTFARRRTAALLAAGITAAVTLAACGGSSDSSSSAASSAGGSGSSGAVTASTSSSASSAASAASVKLSLVGYSTPKKAFDAIIPLFQKTSAGAGVSFSESFGASGSQSRAVATGQSADVVNFSTGPDMTRLVKAGLVASDWDSNPQKGISVDSVVVMVVRRGNPKHITGWDDLVKPGIDVITPNPSTSGSARWNIMGGYGAELKEGKSPAQALAYIKTLLTKNTSVQPASASSALQTFTSGKGDVLLDYESDAIAGQKAGDSIDYVIPKQTLLIETPIAVTAKSSHATQANAFIKYQWSPAGQTIWAQQGYRPVDKTVAKKFASKFPTPPQLFTIDSLGGWTKVKDAFFDPAKGSIIKIEQAAGVPTASS
jgi:sulfate/thiosulfate transport system substrate-binding protein